MKTGGRTKKETKAQRRTRLLLQLKKARAVRKRNLQAGKTNPPRRTKLGETKKLILNQDLWMFPTESRGGGDMSHTIKKAGEKVSVTYSRGLRTATAYAQNWSGRMMSAMVGPDKFKNWPKDWEIENPPNRKPSSDDNRLFDSQNPGWVYDLDLDPVGEGILSSQAKSEYRGKLDDSGERTLELVIRRMSLNRAGVAELMHRALQIKSPANGKAVADAFQMMRDRVMAQEAEITRKYEERKKARKNPDNPIQGIVKAAAKYGSSFLRATKRKAKTASTAIAREYHHWVSALKGPDRAVAERVYAGYATKANPGRSFVGDTIRSFFPIADMDAVQKGVEGDVKKLVGAGKRNPSHKRVLDVSMDLSTTPPRADGGLSGPFKRNPKDTPVEVLQTKGKRVLIKADYFGTPSWGWVDKKYVIVSRENPGPTLDAAQSSFESFHGTPSTLIEEFQTQVVIPTTFAELGTLVSLDFRTPSKMEAHLEFSPDERMRVVLAEEPSTHGLYLIGGDQEVDLGRLGMGAKSWNKPVMVLGMLKKLTYRTQKSFDDFQSVDYWHRAGEETGDKPTLLYDTLAKTLSIAGGRYEIRPEGITN